jgi:hypothetical protein
MRAGKIDWDRVGEIIGARRDGMATCQHCRAQGTVAYIAEHLLATHPTTPVAKRLAKLALATLGDQKPAGEKPA